MTTRIHHKKHRDDETLTVLPCVARQVLGLPRRLADLPPPPRQRILHCLLRACAQNNQIVRNTRYDERTLPIQGRSRRTVGQRLHRGRHGVGVGLRRRRPASHGRLHRSAKSPASPRLALLTRKMECSLLVCRLPLASIETNRVGCFVPTAMATAPLVALSTR
jgi:hypothetical protein